MSSVKHVNRKIIIFVVIYSAITLAIHFIAMKFSFNSVGILLSANDLANASEKIMQKNRADMLKQYSDHISGIFIIMCYIFLVLTGGLCILKKISLFNYLIEIILFGLIQSVGIVILSKFMNNYGMTEIYGRLNVFIDQKLTAILIILPLLFGGAMAIEKR